MAETKTLILVRHAHRSTDDPGRDNGLSDKGIEQVKKLVKFAANRLEGTRPVFLSSPKKRCVETITPIAKEFGTKPEIDSRLTEHGPQENNAVCLARIDNFLDFWKHECPQVTVICSHGDWIPIAIQKLTDARIGIKKAGWIEVEYSGGDAFLTWLVQKVF